MSKADFSAALTRGDLLVGEALGPERAGVDGRRLVEVAVADGIGLDLGDLALGIAERAQRLGHRAVDDLEVAAAGELLELHQREVGLDAGGVAIHDQADRAGRRDHGRLRVAVAVLLAELDGAVPGGPGMVDQRRLLEVGGDERHRIDRQLLVAVLVAIGGAAMVAHDAQHVGCVAVIVREGAELAGHLGRGRIGDAGHDGGERGADGAAFGGVVGNARGHQQAADIGVAEAERAVLVGELARSPSTGTAPSSPRFRAPWSTGERCARRLRCRSCRLRCGRAGG